MKKLLQSRLPESCLVLLFASAQIGGLNYPSLLLLAILVFQVIYQKRGLGVFIGACVLLVTLLFGLALGSELNDFPVINQDAYLMLGMGSLLVLALGVLGCCMLAKYFSRA